LGLQNTTTHTALVTGLADGGSFTYYVRCQDAAGITNTADYVIAFTVASSTPTVSGLRAAYTFNEGMGSVLADASGNGNTATAIGTAWTVGKYGNALAFNGTNSYVQGVNISFSSGPFSLATWFKTGQPGSQMLMGKFNNATNLMYLQTTTSGGIVGGLHDGNGWQEAMDNSQSYADNQWHHAALVVSATTLDLYLDGHLKASGTHDNSFAINANPWNFGRRNDGRLYLKGALDEVRIYGKALTPAEVVADMSTGL
jgi:hypothetical protein